jgi:hypothetical protein
LHIEQGSLSQQVHAMSALPSEWLAVEQLGSGESVLAWLDAHESALTVDAEKGPVFRSLVLRESSVSHYLAVLAHHTVFDGSSVAVFNRELEQLYRQQVLPPLPFQYMDYAAWEREQLSTFERSVWFWSERLQSWRELVLDLPMTSSSVSASGKRVQHEFQLRVSRSVWQQVQRRFGASANQLMLSLTSLWLHQQSGSRNRVRRFAVTTVDANRHAHAALSDMIGMFVNTIVQPLHVDPSTDVESCVKQVRGVCIYLL